MSDQTPDPDVGTQRASLEDLESDQVVDSVATIRPMSTQAVFRPSFDDDDDGPLSEPTDRDEQQGGDAGRRHGGESGGRARRVHGESFPA